MKRDMDLIRKILCEIEDAENDTDESFQIDFNEEYSPNIINYHVKLLYNAGLIEAEDLSDLSGSEYRPISLTWEGHEFLDAIRNDTVWKKVVSFVKEKGASATFEVIKLLAIQKSKELFGLS